MVTSNPAPTPNASLALVCPKCHYREAQLFVSSKSVLTVHCAACGHPWSVEIAALPNEIQHELERLTGN